MPEPEVVSYGQRPSDHVRMTRLITRFDRHIWAGGSTRCIMAHHWWVVSNMAFIFPFIYIYILPKGSWVPPYEGSDPPHEGSDPGPS